MPPDDSAGSRWTGAALRTAFALTGLALAFVTLSEHRALQAAREEAFTWLARAGVTLDAAALGREPNPERVRLRAARAVLAAELDPARHQGVPPAQAARRMEEAARAGREVLAHRPASWEAALVQGGATYLGRARARDPRLFTAYREWEAPLEAALRLAPSRREPVRFLAAAYLESWPALSPRKRQIAHGLLNEVMHDSQNLERLLDLWLETAADRREAFSVVPDDPAVWEKVAAAYARREDLAGYAAARGRQEEALLDSLRRDLLTADRLRGDGQLDEARNLYLSVAVRARPEARYLVLVERALERCPPGPVDHETARRLEPHLARALDRCLLASCEIQPVALKRLSRFVPELLPPQAAQAALFAGDLQHAETYERRSDGMGTESWAPYLVAKARVLAGRGRVDEAREALALLPPAWQRRPLYWQASAEVARAASDPQALAKAQGQIAAAARRSWTATEWLWRRGAARLEVVLAEPAAGVAVTLDQVPAKGAFVELRVDGATVGTFPVHPPAGTAAVLRAAVPLARGLHVVEVDSLEGGAVLPGTAELLGAAGLR